MKHIVYIIFLIANISFSQEGLHLLSPADNSFFTEINDELWIASASKGLNRYRGIDTKHYILNDSSSGLKGTFIQSEMFVDAAGHLWTTTYEYLCVFDPKADQFSCEKITLDDKLLPSGYRIVQLDKKSKTLLLRADGKLLSYSIEARTVSEVLGNTVGNFYEVWHDTIGAAPWLNAEGWELWTKNKDSWDKVSYSFEHCSQLKGRKVLKVYHYLQSIWLLTDDGLILFDKKNICESKIFRYSTTTRSMFSDCVAKDSLIFLNSDHFGVIVFDIKKLIFITKKRIERPKVDDMFLDKHDRIWLSDKVTGLETFPIFSIMPRVQNPFINGTYTSVRSNFGIDLLVDKDNGAIIKKNSRTTLINTSSKMLPIKSVLFSELLDSNRVIFCDRFSCYDYYLDKNTSSPIKLNGIQQIQDVKVYKDQIYLVADNNLNVLNTSNLHLSNIKVNSKSIGEYQFVGELSEEIKTYSAASSYLLISTIFRDTLINIGSFINSSVFDPMTGCHFIGTNNGIYCLDQRLSVRNLTNNSPLLKNQSIFDIQQDNNWVYFNTNELFCRINKTTSNIQVSDRLKFGSRPVFILKESNIIVAADSWIDRSKEDWFNEDTSLDFLIDYIKVNDLIQPSGKLSKVTYDQNNIKWRFYFPDLFNPENCLVLYRLNTDSDTLWKTESNGAEIVYKNLSPGNYTLEVKGMRANGTFTAIHREVFKVLPPWYNTLWFRCLVLFALVGFGYLFYRYKITQIKKEYETQKTIADLERSALQAQMNPHFIFNCLNSIQNFIMQNNKLEAMEYLNRFAKLIRQNLQASTGTTLSLEEEIGILENYIGLEQMRFNNSFDYTIDCDQDLPISKILIPPLLIQPFVENAIIHGVAGLAHRGNITITIAKDKNQLLITVKDNGRGLSAKVKEAKHNSLGMSITEKRLQYINSTASDQYNIDIKSSTSGTTVRILINI